MAKVTLNGEVFAYDFDKKPVSETKAIERAMDMPYGDYEELLGKGSMRALDAFAWTVLKRNGRSPGPLRDFLDRDDDDFDYDVVELSESLDAVAKETRAAAQDPTGGARPRRTRTGSRTAGTST